MVTLVNLAAILKDAAARLMALGGVELNQDEKDRLKSVLLRILRWSLLSMEMGMLIALSPDAIAKASS